MTAANRILSLLDGVRNIGEGRWIAKCPAHHDRSPSFAVREVQDRVLAFCHAECELESIVSAIGLSVSDLFNEPRPAGKKRVDSSQACRFRALKGLDIWASERLTHALEMNRQADRLVDQLSPAVWKLMTTGHPSANRAWDLLSDVIRLREEYDQQIKILMAKDVEATLDLYLSIHERNDREDTTRHRVTA